MEFLAEYGLFLLKAMTIVIAIVLVMAAGAAAGRKATQDHLEVENLNKKYHKTASVLRSSVTKRDEKKKQEKRDKKQQKAEEKRASRPRSFVIDFKGDLKASAVSSLREEVSAVLDVATPDEFEAYRAEGLERGFVEVVAGPMVRSSYRAEQVLQKNNVGLATG